MQHLPSLRELDSRGRRMLLRALAGATRRKRRIASGNHPDHEDDDLLTRARCAACRAEREEVMRGELGTDAEDRIDATRAVNARLVFLAECARVMKERERIDARDVAIEAALRKYRGEHRLVAKKTRTSVTTVARIEKRMKLGAPAATELRAQLEAEHLLELQQHISRARRSDTRENAFALFEAGKLTGGEIAKALGVTPGRVSQLRTEWRRAKQDSLAST